MKTDSKLATENLIKDPFNTLTKDDLATNICFQLDRFCRHNNEAVAVFHINDPAQTMAPYISHYDGMMYLNAATLKLLTHFLQKTALFDRLSAYFQMTLKELNRRVNDHEEFDACLGAPSLDLKSPLMAKLDSDIGTIFKQAMPS